MTPAKLYDKEGLIRLVLSQAETIAVLTREMAVLRARVVELEAKLGLPAKTPDNSSTPPSQGRKASGEVFHGRSPLLQICNDLILAQSVPSGAVHTIIA